MYPDTEIQINITYRIGRYIGKNSQQTDVLVEL